MKIQIQTHDQFQWKQAQEELVQGELSNANTIAFIYGFIDILSVTNSVCLWAVQRTGDVNYFFFNFVFFRDESTVTNNDLVNRYNFPQNW